MAHASSATYLFTRRHLVAESQRRNDDMQVYKWFNGG